MLSLKRWSCTSSLVSAAPSLTKLDHREGLKHRTIRLQHLVTEVGLSQEDVTVILQDSL